MTVCDGPGCARTSLRCAGNDDIFPRDVWRIHRGGDWMCGTVVPEDASSVCGHAKMTWTPMVHALAFELTREVLHRRQPSPTAVSSRSTKRDGQYRSAPSTSASWSSMAVGISTPATRCDLKFHEFTFVVDPEEDQWSPV
ncbi:hypothetical protein MRX96_019169 [Rhipicephalus microplus]